jgi:S-DNA-T family DNA segregation ATPase FtsK/SpoIIIE
MSKKKPSVQDMQDMFTRQMMNMMNPFAEQFAPQPFGRPQLFYAAIEGRQAGPFPVVEISRLIATGSIGKETLVWRQGLAAWQSAVSLPELAGLFPAAAPQTAGMTTPSPPAQARPAPPTAQVRPAPPLPAQARPSKKAPQKTWADYSLPIDGILDKRAESTEDVEDEEAKEKSAILESVLGEFKIEAKVTGISKGPVVTMFEIRPAPGIKLSKITSLEDNIALRLAAASMRIVALIPGKEAVGIEVPNKKRATVGFREIIEPARAVKTEKALPLFLGKDISGGIVSADLAEMPHLLVAGSTGSGKSVCINTMILSLAYHLSPALLRMIFIDPKIVELKLYNGIPHLLAPVITDPEGALRAMRYCVAEMERRYGLLDKSGCRSIKSYNKTAADKGAEHLPYLVVIIDEFADLMAVSGKEMEAVIARLAAMSRAVGIHLVLATQRPSADVITGLIKSNIPSRIAFMVAAMTDSRIIIDSPGAEKLLGKGDMLYCAAASPFPVRAQGAFVSEEEAERAAAYLRNLGEVEYAVL